jgi:hypothetical protein
MPYFTFDCGSGRAAYVGKDREEEMMEDMVEANEFFTYLSWLDDNIDKNKNWGLIFDNNDDDGPTNCMEVIECNLQSDTMNGRIESLLHRGNGENILGEGGGGGVAIKS